MVGLAIVRCSVEPRFFSLSLSVRLSVRLCLCLTHSLTHSFFFTTIIESESDERSNRIRSKSLLGIGVV